MSDIRIVPISVVVQMPDGSVGTLDWKAFQAVNRPYRRGRGEDPDGLRANLRRALANGPRRISEVRPELEKRWKAKWVREVKQALRVKSYMDRSGAWWWELPAANDAP